MNEMSRERSFSVLAYLDGGTAGVDEAVRSVLGQTIGFEDAIELVLLDDSGDASTAALCDEYAAAHPNNVRVLRLGGIGLAKALATGAEQAHGAFTCLLRAGMVWNADAFKVARDYAAAHPEAGAIAARLVNGEYTDLDYRFAETRLVNVFDEWDAPQPSLCGLFVRTPILGTGLALLPEDTTEQVLASFMVMHIGTYALLKECECTCANGSSADVLQGAAGQVQLPDVLANCERLSASSRSLYGYIIPYAQYAAMYLLKRALPAVHADALPASERPHLRSRVHDVLAGIDDQAILKQREFGLHWKLHTLAIKHDSTFEQEQELLKLSHKQVLLAGEPLSAAESRVKVVVERIDDGPDGLRLEGRVLAPFPQSRMELRFNGGDQTFTANLYNREDTRLESPLDGGVCPCIGFSATLSLSGSCQISCTMFVDGKKWRAAGIGFSRTSRMKNAFNECYTPSGSGRLSPVSKKAFRFERLSGAIDIVKNERRIARGLAKTKGKRQAAAIAFKRGKAVLAHAKRGPKIWLISDDLQHASGAGAALFQRVCEVKPQGVKAYYVLSQQSSDFPKMKATGPVVAKESKEYANLFLQAEYLISSSTGKQAAHHFGANERCYAGVYAWKFVHLLHADASDGQQNSQPQAYTSFRSEEGGCSVHVCDIDAVRAYCIAAPADKAGFDAVLNCLLKGLRR